MVDIERGLGVLMFRAVSTAVLTVFVATGLIFSTAPAEATFKTNDDDIIVNPEDVYVDPDSIVVDPGDVVVDTSDLNLPTWEDVEKAKQSKNAAASKVTEIEALLVQVQQMVEAARQKSEDASTKAMIAQDDFRKAHLKAEELQRQADESEAEANEASEQAAGLVSQMYRSGGIDRNLELFLETDAETADVLLDKLAMMQKATERNSSVAEQAEYAMNNAETLGEQAQAAQEERERLSDIAEQEATIAAEAVAAARNELAATEAQEIQLQTQLAALKDEEVDTTAGYEERLDETERRRQVEEQRLYNEAYAAAENAAIEAAKEEIRRKRAEEEAARIAAEQEAARIAAEKEARKNQGGSSGGGSSGGGGSGSVKPATPAPPPVVSESGWINPLADSYRITTEWWGYWGHEGMDMALGEGYPIYAAQSGQVAISGWWGGCGNMVHLEHVNNVSTRYCHMVYAPSVVAGQWVGAGQILGYVGTTGFSTGNHLHYETWIDGVAVDPRPFMDNRGVWL